MMDETTRFERDADGVSPEEPAQASEFYAGQVLWDRYEVIAALGASDLGEVWRCHDRQENKDVVLRHLPRDLGRSKAIMSIIHAGIQRISDSTHPSLSVIRQLVYMGDQIYLVGDFAPGVDIGTWGREGEGGRRALEDVLPVLEQVAAALDYAHERRIIHRNLKPSNIYLDDAGVARVTDFGLRPRRHRSLPLGAGKGPATVISPYLAPELQGDAVATSASDQYALAAVAWELLAGVSFEIGAPADLPPEVPRSARTALARALAAKPLKRFVSCTDFTHALAGERVWGRRRRSREDWGRIGRMIGLVAGVAALAATAWFGSQALVLWLERPKDIDYYRPPDLKPAAPVQVVQVRETRREVRPLVATTPLPVAGKPWVAHTVPMEFVWVGAMQMWVGRFEVTNEEYLKKEPEHSSGEFKGVCLSGSRQPVVRVNFDDVMAYAAWLTEQERAAGKLPDDLAYRLPSRAEAVAYTRAGSSSQFPWGENWPPTRGNYADAALGTAFPDENFIDDYQDGFPTTAPVEMSGENIWALFGAGGNVCETTSREPGGDRFGGWQGGGWNDYEPNRVASTAVYGFVGNARGAVNGFRLVLVPVVEQEAGETAP
ncbi:MAG: protein kinase [Lentisphaerae bacterium]|jgi:serine/threonine-protein kinase|nr:protein kinase [Lentisphaerota bacterium]